MYSQNQLSKIHPALLLPIDEFQKSIGCQDFSNMRHGHGVTVSHGQCIIQNE